MVMFEIRGIKIPKSLDQEKMIKMILDKLDEDETMWFLLGFFLGRLSAKNEETMPIMTQFYDYSKENVRIHWNIAPHNSTAGSPCNQEQHEEKRTVPWEV